MNSVDTLVRKSILSYPSLFQSRTEVLYFVLCVIGNGYEWDENGEIVNLHHEEYKQWTAEHEIETHNKTYAKFDNEEQSFILDLLRKPLNETIATCEKRVREVDELMTTRTSIENFYTQSNYSLLFNMPDNVTHDWAEACNEIKKEAATHGWVF